MIRNLKAMGLALVALLAMSAFASTASAQFESEQESTILTTSNVAGTTQMQKFAPTSGGTAVECTTITLSNSTQTGTSSGGAFVTTTATVTPTYSNCENFLGQSTAVAMNGCQYVFHLNDNATSGTTDVACPAGKVIEITVGNICKYTIGSQNGLSSVKFSNVGVGTTREVTVEPNVTGITSTRTTNHFFCPNGGSTGTYTGNSRVTGENAEGNHVGIFVD